MAIKGVAWALLPLIMLAASGGFGAEAQEAPPDPVGGTFQSISSRCWKAPTPQTVEEAVIVAQNEANVAAGNSAGPAAMLALSDGRLKVAYSAGLLVGWGETGTRPEFSRVTAVGMSALLAPFAFLGQAGDAAIADVFACDASSLQKMAEHAIVYLTPDVLERIAHRHEQGARLLVALPGSAARSETVWDIGALAASRHRDAHRLIASILLASVDLTTFVDPATIPVKAGFTSARNPALRRLGAGEAFLATPSLGALPPPTYLIHNGVLFADESEEHAAEQALHPDAPRPNVWLQPASNFFSAAQQWHAPIRVASPRAYMNIQPQQSAFDLTYMRALFLDAYRQGRMSREWRSTILDVRSR